MKKLLSLIVFALYGFVATAQVSKTVNITTASTLSTLLTPTELSTVTNLTVTGNIDARDIKTMRDDMPLLAVLDMGVVSIQAYTGNAGTYNGNKTYPANEMPQYSFYNGSTGKTTLKIITIPSSITSIGGSAFSMCTGLSGSLILPNTLTTIGDGAFSGCSGFTGSLTIPNSVTSIRDYAFSGCSGMTGSLTIPNLVTLIGNYAFESCSGFTGTLTFGSGLTSIGDNTFKNCYFFKIINNLNTTPPVIKTNTFSGGVNISIVYVPITALAAYKAASIWSSFNIIAEKHVSINVSNAGGMAAAIIDGGFGPLNSVTHLAVTGNLNSVDINQMTTNMTALTAINLSAATIASNALPANAFQGRTSLTSVLLPSNLLSIGEFAFDGCISLSGNIPLSASVTSIGASAFGSCGSLTGTLTIPLGITVINNNTFANCSNLTGNLIIPNSVSTIGNAAFSGCRGFTGSLTIPNTVTSLGTSAFQGCSGFNGTLTLPNTLTSVSDYAFESCSQLIAKVEIPLSVMSIGISSFRNCAKITELSVGKNLSKIDDYALSRCSSLVKISVPRTTPPTINANTFAEIPKESCTINVPTGASLNYQIANYWSAFINFVEILSSDNYTVTVSIVAGGSVKENNITLGNGSVLTAAIGSTKTFTFAPNAGYAVATVTYGGVDVTSQLVNYQYTTPAINANATLVVTFKKTQYLLSIKSAESGVVNLLCEFGATPSFNFTAFSGWKVNTLLYNGVDITNSLTNGVYTVPAVSADALLTVSFEQTNALQVPSLSNVKVYTHSDEIIVEGSIAGETISLFNINGKQITSLKSQGERIAIPAQKDRVYLVKTEGRIFKVML